jgi:hypothetical protein
MSTFLFLGSFENLSRFSGGTDFFRSASAQVFTFDGCTFAFGFGTGFITNPVFKQNNVTSATLTGTFTVFDDFTGALLATVNADVTWTGVGTVNRSHSTSTSNVGPFVFTSRQIGTSRSATVSGTLTVNGLDMVPFAQFAALADSKSGNVNVTKN